MSVCMSANQHVCVQTYMRACVHACMRACVRACVRPCVRACVRACVHGWMTPLNRVKFLCKRFEDELYSNIPLYEIV